MKRLMLLIVLSGLIFSSCEKETPTPPTPVSRTMLIYMSANNSLSGDAYSNIDGIKSAVKSGALNGGKILILWRKKPTSASTQLIEIFRNSKGEAQERIHKDYGGNMNASEASFMRQAIEDMKHYAPAEKYCLDLWSHALGWIPASDWRPADSPSTFSFGDDEDRSMNINDMADAIDKDIFDFILFDCCLMGNIETLYQLRDKTPYIIASPIEIVGVGMPYDKIVPVIFGTQSPNLKGICDAYYNADTDSRVISIYDMSKVEGVAAEYADMVAQYRAQNIREDRKDPIEHISYSYLYNYVQRLDRSSTRWSFDMLDLSKQLTANNSELQSAIESMVIYKLFHTSAFGYIIDPYRFCGLGMSLPLDLYNTQSSTKTWTPYYKTIDWYTRTYNQ